MYWACSTIGYPDDSGFGADGAYDLTDAMVLMNFIAT
jgi:hypothetical protein